MAQPTLSLQVAAKSRSAELTIGDGVRKAEDGGIPDRIVRVQAHKPAQTLAVQRVCGS
jgi:hypothetical protein